MRPIPALLPTLALAAILALAGCSRTPDDPYETKIESRSPAMFGMWHSELVDHFKPDQIKEIDDSIQEIKLAVTAHHVATGAAEVDQSMRDAINGHTVREALRFGWESKLQRLQDELGAMQKSMEQNSRLVTHDDASKDNLDALTDRQKAHVARLNAGIAEAQQKIAAYQSAFKDSANPVKLP